MNNPLESYTDLEIFEEFIRRIKSKKGWNHYGMEIIRTEDSDYSIDYEIRMKHNTPEVVGFMFDKPACYNPIYADWHRGDIKRIWGSNPHWEWMKV